MAVYFCTLPQSTDAKRLLALLMIRAIGSLKSAHSLHDAQSSFQRTGSEREHGYRRVLTIIHALRRLAFFPPANVVQETTDEHPVSRMSEGLVAAYAQT